MPSRIYKILNNGFFILFYIILTGLFLKGEIFRIHTKWISLSFTSVKNFIFIFAMWWILLEIINNKIKIRVSLWPIFIIILGMFSVIFSPYYKISMRALGVLLIYILWFYSLKYVYKNDRHILNSVLLLIGISGLVNLINLYFHYTVNLSEILEKYPFWQGKNAFGLFLVIGLCLSGTLILDKKWSWILVINSLLLILGIVFSYSRNALICSMIAIIGIIIFRLKKSIWLIAGCIIIVFVIAAPFISKRFDTITSKEDVNISQRLNVWNNSIAMIKNKPLLGYGLGTFNKAYMEEYASEMPETGEGSRPFRHAHNLYLQILVENGIIGFILFLVLVIAGVYYGIRNLIKERRHCARSIRYGCLLGIFVFLVYSLADCTTTWQFVGDSFSHINLIWLILWAIVLMPASNPQTDMC